MAVKSGGDKLGVIERAGIKLAVPQEYIYENRFPWIDEAKNLDSADASFMIQIPAETVKSVLPDKAIQKNQNPIDLTVVVSLLTLEEKKKSLSVAQSKIDEIVKKQGTYEKAYIKLDEETGYYLVYMNPEWPWWDVFSRSPFENSGSVGPGDLIARCQKYENIGIQCTLSRFVLGNVMIEFSLKGEYLPYHKHVQDYIASLLKSWQVKDSH